MNFAQRKAQRTADYFDRRFKFKLRTCTACSGSGRYDNHGGKKCGCCNGTGKEEYRDKNWKTTRYVLSGPLWSVEVVENVIYYNSFYFATLEDGVVTVHYKDSYSTEEKAQQVQKLNRATIRGQLSAPYVDLRVDKYKTSLT